MVYNNRWEALVNKKKNRYEIVVLFFFFRFPGLANERKDGWGRSVVEKISKTEMKDEGCAVQWTLKSMAIVTECRRRNTEIQQQFACLSGEKLFVPLTGVPKGAGTWGCLDHSRVAAEGFTKPRPLLGINV